MSKRFKTIKQGIDFCVGRLQGMTGTVRYDQYELSDKSREELQEVVEILEELSEEDIEEEQRMELKAVHHLVNTKILQNK
jgi:hypothetical protein